MSIRISTALRCAALLFAASFAAQAKEAGRIDADAFTALRALPEGGKAAVELHWPGEAGKRPIQVERIDVYAPQARVIVIDESGSREIPRSPLAHYIARRGERRMVFSLPPDGGAGTGVLMDIDGTWHLQAEPDAEGLRLVALETVLPDGSRPDFECGGSLESAASLPLSEPEPAEAPQPQVATRQVVVAMDTDSEYMSLRFSNNTTNASNYIAQLLAAMSLIYEQEPADGGVKLKLALGDVILRVGTDPYNTTSSSSMNQQLDEFANHWRLNETGRQRAFAMLLSGKSGSSNGLSASGIAWIVSQNNYCAQTGVVQSPPSTNVYGHYSVNRLFFHPATQVAWDVSITAHELGHNMGLAHTHCTNLSGVFPSASNTIDQCHTSGSGCYSGPTSCPAGGAGTLMSYCHLGACAAENLGDLHPVQVTTLNARLAAQSTSCVTPIGQPNQAPSISLPGSIAVTEDVTSAVSGISFADPDAGSGSLTATFSVPSGSLSATNGGGVTVGGNASSRTLAGTLSNLNSFLSAGNLKFTTAPNATANVTLNVAINDNGNTGNGGAQTASGSVTLTVSAVNDAPTISAPATFKLNEGTTPLTGVSFGDVDAGGATNIVVTLASAEAGSGGSSSGGVTVGGSAASRTYTGSLANLNAYFAAGHATLTPNGGFTTGTLSITINDNGNTGSGGALSASASVSLRGVLFANGFE